MFDFAQVVDKFCDMLTELSDHLIEHQMVEGWEESVNQINHVLEAWKTYKDTGDVLNEKFQWTLFWYLIAEHMQGWWD